MILSPFIVGLSALAFIAGNAGESGPYVHLQHARSKLYLSKGATRFVKSKDDAGTYAYTMQSLYTFDVGKWVDIKGGCRGNIARLTLLPKGIDSEKVFQYKDDIFLEIKCTSGKKVLAPDPKTKEAVLVVKDPKNLDYYKINLVPI
ncbi:uncharacterized protein LOC132705473 isoform X2 [Cylas formicarius]|uniref:uncharacterized protein LOC132705473 isoform X2 n=1 Tax=Cylas formicarius TaxID=197179 RepID=UPI002958B1E4|nr:uncharacterized protein LOC132705473 isoform X2 [Cylas formicarius]